MKKIFTFIVMALLSLRAFGQSQGVSMRATNGVAFGDTIVQTHVRATNTTTTNTFAGKFQQGQGTVANGTGSSAFGLGTRSSGSYGFSSGIGSINVGPSSFASGSSNNITSSALNSFASGNKNYALDPATFVTGTSNVVAGSNSFVTGFDIVMESLSPNSFLGGQHISALSGSSNNFVWNGDPATPLTIPATTTNAFTVMAPGGIFFNGVQFTGGGGSSETGMKTNQFTTNTVGVPIVGNVNLGGATNNASGDFGVNGTLGTGTANAGTLGVSGNATVNGTLSSSTSTSGVFTVTGTIVTTITNQYPYFDANGVMRGTNNGAGWTNLPGGGGTVYASNVVSGGVLPAGTVSASTATAGYVLATDGTLRQWTNRVTLAQIDGQVIHTSFIRVTNTSAANFYTDIGGSGAITNVSPNGNGFIMLTNASSAGTYTLMQSPSNGVNSTIFATFTNSVSRFSVTSFGTVNTATSATFGGVVTGSGMTASGAIQAGTVFTIATNYTAANFIPVAGQARMVCSNGALYKVTQVSTNLISPE